jgi:hypothetical protein
VCRRKQYRQWMAQAPEAISSARLRYLRNTPGAAAKTPLWALPT